MKWWLLVLVACSSEPPLAMPTQIDTGHFIRKLVPVGDRMLFVDNDKAWWTMPLDGSAPAQALPGLPAVDRFDVDLANVYFVGSNADGTHDLMRQPFDGATAELVAAGVPSTFFSLTATSAVFLGPRFANVPIAGIQPVEPDPRSTTPADLAFDDENVYSLGGIMFPSCEIQRLAGGAATVFYCNGNRGITAHAGTMYVTYGSDQDSSVSSVSMIDAASQKQTKLADAYAASEIVIRDGQLYWREFEKIVRANLDGSHQTVIARPPPKSYLYAMAVDATSVYYATSMTFGPSAVYVIPK